MVYLNDPDRVRHFKGGGPFEIHLVMSERGNLRQRTLSLIKLPCLLSTW